MWLSDSATLIIPQIFNKSQIQSNIIKIFIINKLWLVFQYVNRIFIIFIKSKTGEKSCSRCIWDNSWRSHLWQQIISHHFPLCRTYSLTLLIIIITNQSNNCGQMSILIIIIYSNSRYSVWLRSQRQNNNYVCFFEKTDCMMSIITKQANTLFNSEWKECEIIFSLLACCSIAQWIMAIRRHLFWSQ